MLDRASESALPQICNISCEAKGQLCDFKIILDVGPPPPLSSSLFSCLVKRKDATCLTKRLSLPITPPAIPAPLQIKEELIVAPNPSDSKLAQIYNGSAFASGFTLSQVSRSTTSTASTATPSATATNQVVSPTPNSDDRNENSAPAPAKVSTTTKVGVGVGVGVGVPLLAALGATLFLWSKEKKRGRELQQRAAAGAGQEPPWAKAQEGYKEGYGAGGSQRVHEMPGRLGDDGIKEMDGAERRREMAAHPSMKYNPPG
ncbi:MAG: hypothetical protein Q9203_002953 [Teloschistes exilis]